MHITKKQRIYKTKPVQIIIWWRKKVKSDIHDIVYSSGFVSINFTVSRTRVIENI